MPPLTPPSGRALWTKPFTAAIAASSLSTFSALLAEFALGFLVLGATDDPAFYAGYLFLNTLPQIAAPMVAGPLVDRLSRAKALTLLDGAAAALFLLAVPLMGLEGLIVPAVAVMALAMGALKSVYLVAFNSLVPLLVPPSRHDKAGSVLSMQQTVSYLMMAPAILPYQSLGVGAVCLACAGAYAGALVLDALLVRAEKRLESSSSRAAGEEGREGRAAAAFLADTADGLRYLWGERGLMLVTACFSLCTLAYGASSALTLPWFRANRPNGELAYMAVWGLMVLGRIVGGMLLYRDAPAPRLRPLLFVVGCGLGLALEGVYLYGPAGAMQPACLLVGVLRSLDALRVSAGQRHVPNELQGRYNAAVQVLSIVGKLLGQAAAAGALVLLSTRGALALIMLGTCAVLLALCLMGRRSLSALLERSA